MNKLFFLAIALTSCFAAAAWPPGVHPQTSSELGEDFKSFAPQMISVQGLLLNASTGAPVENGAYSMNFSVWNAATGGNMLWNETQSVQVSNGYFDVLLGATGFAGGFNCFSNQFNADLFTAIACAQASAPDNVTRLEIRIGSETLSPRYNITVAPFAYAADYATVTLEQVTALGNWTTHGLNASTTKTSIYASSTDPYSAAIYAVGNESSDEYTYNGTGVYGRGRYGVKGYGNASSGTGVYGRGYWGVEGSGDTYTSLGRGVYGSGYYGVEGYGNTSVNGTGVYGSGYYGVKGQSVASSGTGVYGMADVNTYGAVGVNGSGY
ncbi:MAG: hypothetical protein ACP5IG_04295, partial [Candidatus Micrarchaeia archaeon]